MHNSSYSIRKPLKAIMNYHHGLDFAWALTKYGHLDLFNGFKFGKLMEYYRR